MTKKPHDLLLPRAGRYGMLYKERFILRYPLWLLLIIPAVVGYALVFVVPIFEEMDGYWSPAQRKWREDNAVYEQSSDMDDLRQELGGEDIPTTSW